MTESPSQLFVKGGHPMSFEDKSIQCSDCGTTFTFSADEQELFASRERWLLSSETFPTRSLGTTSSEVYVYGGK